MADEKLSALTALTPLADGDFVYVVRSGSYYKSTVATLRAAVGGIEGNATNYAALPVTVGTPAVGTRYIVDEDQGSYFTFNKFPAGLYQRTANNGVSADWVRLGDFTLVPFRDDQAFYDNVDGTKTLKFQLSGITTSTERVATWQDKDGTVAMTNDKLSAAAATTSAELAGVISDETGTGALVFATNPVLVTPNIGTPSSGVLTNTTDYPVASTSRTGATPQATAPAAGLLSVLAIGNGETVRTDQALFDTTNPANLGSVSPGTSKIAARRDHVHAMPSAADVGAATTSTKLDDFGAPDDNTDLNATTSAHGLLPKLGGGSTNFLRADGTWAAPAGGGGGTDIFDFTQLDAVATFGGSTLACNVPYRATAVGTGTLTTYAGSDFPAAEIRTGTTSGWGHYVAFLASSGTSNTFDLDETHTWMMQFHIRTGADIGNYRLLVGAVGTAGAAVPVAGIGVRFDTDASDTNFRLAAWDASTPTLGSDNLGAVAINTVYVVKIWCDGDGTVRATVNGGTQSTLTTGFTATRVTPLFQLINSTTADKRMQVARVAFHIEGLSP